jgi:hypothetical protein
MSVLLNLPHALVSSVLSNWLTMEDVYDLDSAFCNRLLRDEFMKSAYLFRTPVQYPQIKMPKKVCERFNSWALKKGAPMLGFFVTEALLRDHNGRKAYLEMHGGALRWVDFRYCERHSMGDGDYRLMVSDIAANCPKLARLSSMGFLSEECLVMIAQHCLLLEDVEVS